jgi:hypothetical protein
MAFKIVYALPIPVCATFLATLIFLDLIILKVAYALKTESFLFLFLIKKISYFESSLPL